MSQLSEGMADSGREASVSAEVRGQPRFPWGLFVVLPWPWPSPPGVDVCVDWYHRARCSPSCPAFNLCRGVCRQVLRHVIAPKQDWVAHYDDDADAPDMEGGQGPARNGPVEASRRALSFQP